MAWTLSNEGMVEAGQMTDAEKAAFNAWAQRVATGENPKTAADSAGDMDYEVYKGAPTTVKWREEKPVAVKCCSIRLSKSCRVFFMQVDVKEFVQVLRVGDHNEPTWPKTLW